MSDEPDQVPGVFSFHPLQMADLSLLRGWLTRPHIAEWWGADEASTAASEILEDSHVRPYIARLDGTPIGFIQSYIAMGSGDGWWEHETDPGVRGIDQFLADESQLGRGLGSRMVAAFVAQLFREPAVSKVQTDPSPGNRRAVRCYEKAGFRVVRELLTPDGPALLMIAERAAPPSSL